MFLIDIHFNFEISTYKTMLSFLILLSTALTLSSAWSDSEYLVSLDGVDDDNHLGKCMKDYLLFPIFKENRRKWKWSMEDIILRSPENPKNQESQQSSWPGEHSDHLHQRRHPLSPGDRATKWTRRFSHCKKLSWSKSDLIRRISSWHRVEAARWHLDWELCWRLWWDVLWRLQVGKWK